MKTARFYIGNIGPFKRNSSFYVGLGFLGFALWGAIESLKDGFQYADGDLMFIIPAIAGVACMFASAGSPPYDLEDAIDFETKGRDELFKTENINYEQAIDNVNKALSIYPFDPSSQSAYKTRAWLKERIGKYKDAISDYTSAIETSPENDNQPDYFGYTPQSCLYRERGRLKKETGDLKGACEDWKKAAELGDEDAAKLLKENCA